MSSKLYNPTVLGPGITIERTPTDPKHAVRKVDLENYTRAEKYLLENVSAFSIEKLSDDFIIQFYDENKQKFQPNSVTDNTDTIDVTFVVPQSGKVVVLFIGGKGGD